MKQLPEVIGGLISDGLELLDVLGGSTAGAMASGALKSYRQRRTDNARKLLFEELARGDILPPQAAAKDDIVAVIYQYFRSACMGTARVNLRLLAQGIAGRLRSNTLVADEFLPHADTLSSLSRDEVTLLAVMLRCYSAANRSNFHRWEDTEAELINRHGWDKARTQATGGRALRSGYVLPELYGMGQMVVAVEIHYRPSWLLLELCKTVDFDDALRREAQGAPTGTKLSPGSTRRTSQ